MLPIHATVVPRPAHSISRANISAGALKVLYRLKGAGFEGYLVGGGVRDLLLGREPKDFDIVTDARPEQIKELFRSCRLIGRRFRLAHVRQGGEILEVATFRSSSTGAEDDARVLVDGRILRDNAYGTLEEDAWRRDFTVNCLYYNIRDFSVVDFTGGMQDLEAGVLRLIGEPQVRYREDAVRMLRAIRFAAKLGFRLEPDTEAPIGELAPLLEEIPAARLFDEVLKLLLSGHGASAFEQLERYDLFRRLFPQTHAAMQRDESGFARRLVLRALENTDARVLDGRPVTPAFLFAALLWSPLRSEMRRLHGAEDVSELQAMDIAGAEVVARQVQRVAFPRRFSLVAREIWGLQPRLGSRRGRRAAQLLAHPRFRAGYDFLLLRAEAGEDLGDLPGWWTEYQKTGSAPAGETPAPAATRPRRRRRRRAASAP